MDDYLLQADTGKQIQPVESKLLNEHTDMGAVTDRSPMGVSSDSSAVADTTQEYKAPEGASVSQRLLDLLDKDNPFITRAKTSAAQAANARGLQNSSMAVTAGETAAIDTAAPIAQADAELFTSLYSNDKATKDKADLYRLQGDITKDINEQQAGFELGRLEKQGDIELSKLESQGQIDLAKQEAQNLWEDKFLQDKIALEKQQLGTDTRRTVTDAFNVIQEEFQRDWLEILLNPNFATAEDRQKALDDLIISTESRISILSTAYNVKLDWEAPGETHP